MFKTLIYLLLISFVSTRGRVADSDDPLPDIATNTVKNVAEINVSEIYIELPTIKPDGNDKRTLATTTESVNSNTIPSAAAVDINPNAVPIRDIKENTINSEENEVLPEEDSGIALKLTQFITENRLDEARSAAKVNPEMFLGIESYSGFFTVNETYDSNLFFWYFPVDKKPANETPWIIWLQGGPGASSMTGLFDELGPFRVTSDFQLVRNPFSWLQNHSLLFIDNPVGAGFSYTTSVDGYVLDMETYGAHLYSAVQQFLKIFPELRAAPLYIAGESYAGKYVPVLAMNIHRHKHEEDINLQGLITGNAYVDPAMISQMERPFYYFGLLEPEQIEVIRPLIQALKQTIADRDSKAAKENWNHLITIILLITHQKHAYNFLRDELAFGRYIRLLHKPAVVKALHAGGIEFNFVNMTVNEKLNGDFLSSAKWMYEELLPHYRVLTYCGQLDQMLSCVLTSENYRTWNWNGSKEFLEAVRHPYIYNGRLSGYHKSGGHLTEVVIRGAGHMAPMDAPGPTQKLVASWTHQRNLSTVPLLEGNFVQEYIRNNTLSNIVHYL